MKYDIVCEYTFNNQSYSMLYSELLDKLLIMNHDENTFHEILTDGLFVILQSLQDSEIEYLSRYYVDFLINELDSWGELNQDEQKLYENILEWR